MNKFLTVVVLVILVSFNGIFADENIDLMVGRFPFIVAHYSPLVAPSTDKKIVWVRTDNTIPIFSINKLTTKENQLHINNAPDVF